MSNTTRTEEALNRKAPPESVTLVHGDNGRSVHRDPEAESRAFLERYPIRTARQLIEEFPDPPTPVIEGIVGEGEKLIVAGPSKLGKTFFLLNLADAVAQGENWMGHQCHQGRVLFINFEVSEPRMAQRNQILREARVDMPGVDFWNLRGAKFDWKLLIETLDYLAREHHYTLIILDPIYKLAGSTPENDNTAVAEMLLEVERIAVETAAAVAFAHHFSKGNKAGVESIDRMSGAGTFARDPDAILTLTAHEEEKCFTLESTVRNYAKPESVVVEFTFPVFTIREDLDAGALKQSTRGGQNRKGGEVDVAAALRGHGKPLAGTELAALVASMKGVTERTAYSWIKKAEAAGLIENHQGLWTTESENP